MYPSEEDPGDSPCVKDQIEELRKSGLIVDIKIIDRKKKLNYLLAAWDVFRASFGFQKYDLIHGFYGHCGLIACCQFRLPVVITFRGSDILTFKDGVFGQIAARFARKIIVMSEEMKKKSFRNDAVILPFGVNMEVFFPTDYAEARSSLNLSSDFRYILFPYDPKRSVKRFDLIQDIVKNVNDRGYPTKLLVVSDQPPHKVAQYMNACDVLVLVSDHEGSPMAVREAMACNMPIVSVDVGDVKNLLDGVDNCYLTSQDVNEVTLKIIQSFITGTRTNGRDKIFPHSNQAVSQSVVEVYKSICKF
jgi:glycosyltransferase involved in cell wall biosynthesis